MSLTLEDIARLSGSSRSTVSRVINGDAKVSVVTRQRILNVIEANNFQPNLAARRLAAGRTQVLGLIIPMGVSAIFTDPFFSLLIQGVSSACNQQDYSVMLWLAEPEYERRMVGKILHNGLVDGVLAASILAGDPIVEALAQGSLPFVLIGRHAANSDVNYVDADNRCGAREAVRHLLRLGHTRVAAINGPQSMLVGQDRFAGYCDALHERGMPVRSELVIEADFSEGGGYESMQRLLSQQPDAVFAASDVMAGGALRALHEARLGVPQNVSVVGFDDVPTASAFHPALTTVRQPIQRVGSTAAETLIDMIENPAPGPRHIILPTELVIRESTGPKR